MKKIIIITVLITGMLALSSSSFGHGWPYYRHYGGCGWGSCGWETAAVVGGSILLGTFLGMAINSNYRYAYPPRPVYGYPGSEAPYAAPDPAFIERYSGEKSSENYPAPVYSSRDSSHQPPGAWITVPGQWVQGIWVPAHQVWLPENR